jgi:dolichol-phosphate mannosyltransferase
MSAINDQDPVQFSRLNLDRYAILIGAVVFVRLLFLGWLNLLPEEAYYWSYSRHLDLGYLDHPPMVAWLIYISEFIFGRSEFAVRLPAFLGWLLFAYFMYRFSVNTVGNRAGKLVLLLVAVLPIYLTTGFLMTPDAPFYVCWAGALFFLERAAIANKVNAWYGFGICIGLGMLSKYSMGLMVMATLLFLIIDKDSRHWLRRPQPYLAFAIGAILFLPVLFWNSQHNWASFAFQGPRRWSGGINFQLHVLIGSALLLITPLGFSEALKSLGTCWQRFRRTDSVDTMTSRTSLFLGIFCAAPLAVFVIHSLIGQHKLNWTGPVWLAILPVIALNVFRAEHIRLLSRRASRAKLWTGLASFLLVAYVLAFGYLVAGMPGSPKTSGMKLPIAWKAFGERVKEIRTALEKEIGSKPIIIGLDQYWLASQASFYDPDGADGLPDVAALNLVGGNSVMWDLWTSPGQVAGRDAVLISFTKDQLEARRVTQRFSILGEINKEVLTNSLGEIGLFYWRAGYTYTPL